MRSEELPQTGPTPPEVKKNIQLKLTGSVNSETAGFAVKRQGVKIYSENQKKEMNAVVTEVRFSGDLVICRVYYGNAQTGSFTKEVMKAELEQLNDCTYELVLPENIQDTFNLCGNGYARRVPAEAAESRSTILKTARAITAWVRKCAGWEE